MTVDLKRVKEIFLEAAELPDEAARTAFLDRACRGEAGVRERVEALLRSHDPEGSFLGTAAAVVPDPSREATQALTGMSEPGTQAAQTTDGEVGSPDDEPMTFLAPPTRSDSLGRIGHYEVLQILGKGGFGIVFRAFDETLQRVVALKVMAPLLAATSPARKRFLREARSSAQVRHENVVQVYGVEEQPLPYLVMEFIPGETLQQRLNRVGPLDVPETLRIGRQIAEGLAAAHATELIHRDIKPGNVILEGGQQKVKITDFGLARTADDASISQSGIIAGTPMYMAPEQAQGQPLDQRADLFSLGSVLYQMVSGRPPFRANTTVAVLKRVAEDQPRAIREIIPETPQWLCDIIAKLHAKDPEDRYQSAREVADVLADCEAQLKTNSRLKDYSRIPRSKPQRLGRWKWAAAAAAVLLPVIALAVTEFAGLTQLFRGQQVTHDLSKPGGVQTPSVEVVGEKTPERQAAEYVLSIGGTIKIKENDTEREVKATSDLPKGAFYLTYCNLVKNNQVNDAGLASFKGCKNLTIIDLYYTQVSDVGLAHLKECTSLIDLGLQGTQVSDAGMAQLKEFKGLKTLFVGASKVGDAGLAHIKECKNLTHLFLPWAPVSDAGLVHLKECKVLMGIELMGTKVTDAGLAHLKECKNLRWVWLKHSKVTEAGIEELAKALPQCRIEWDGGVIEPNVAFAPFTDADVKRIAALPAAEQVDEVRNELKSRNSGFDGKVESTIKEGAVTDLSFSTEQVTDIAPVRALVKLQNLGCFTGKLSDISPLKGLELSSLNLAGTQVSDLSPLQGMPLKSLNLHLCSQIKDLTPLKGMPLFWLNLAACSQIKDLTPLKGMPLTSLNLHTCSEIKDLTPLKGMPLVSLNIHDGPSIKDFSPLKDMPLKELSAGGNPVHDLSPLKGLPLTYLILSHCPQVDDISPLKGLSLNHLALDDTPVQDLSPLKGMPLKSLYANAPNITDLKPLQAVPLEDIRLNPKNFPQGLDILRGMKSLKTIGLNHYDAWPAAEFWQRYDKGEFTKTDADRQAAEFVLSTGGSIFVDDNHEIKVVPELPKVPFRLTGIDLSYRPAPIAASALAVFKDCKNLTRLIINGQSVTDEGLAQFKDCTTLTYINMHDNEQVTDAGLAWLKDCKKLTALDVSNATKVSNAGLAHLKDCTELTKLWLCGTQVNDAGLPHLKAFKNLTFIQMEGLQVTDAGLAHLNGLDKLTSLFLSKTQVTAKGIDELAKALPKCAISWDGGMVGPNAKIDPDRKAAEYVLSIGGMVKVDDQAQKIKDAADLPGPSFGLTYVSLRGSQQVTDTGLAVFKDCDHLKHLELTSAKVSDAGLAHLQDCKALKSITVDGTKVTAAGIDQLKSALPQCRIEWDGGVVGP